MTSNIQEKLRKKLATMSRTSTTQSEMINDVSVIDPVAVELAQKALLADLEKEEKQRDKKSEKNKRRKQALKKKVNKTEDAASLESQSEQEEEAVEVATVTVTPTPAPAAPSLADQLEQAEISVVIERDAVSQLQLEISEILAELEAGRQELELLQARRSETSATAAQCRKVRETADSEIRQAQQSGEAAVRQVEELRRELDRAEHRRFRARQDFEKNLAGALSQIQSEIDLVEMKIRRTVNDRNRLASEEVGNSAAEKLQKEREKLKGVLKMIGVPESLFPAVLRDGKTATYATSLLPSLTPESLEKLLAARDAEEKKKRKELDEGSANAVAALDAQIHKIRACVPMFLIDGCTDASDREVIAQAKFVLERAAQK